MVDVVLTILVAGTVFVLSAVLLGFGIRGMIRLWQRFRAAGRPVLARSWYTVDADCPEGYVCRDGCCVPA